MGLFEFEKKYFEIKKMDYFNDFKLDTVYVDSNIYYSNFLRNIENYTKKLAKEELLYGDENIYSERCITNDFTNYLISRVSPCLSANGRAILIFDSQLGRRMVKWPECSNRTKRKDGKWVDLNFAIMNDNLPENFQIKIAEYDADDEIYRLVANNISKISEISNSSNISNSKEMTNLNLRDLREYARIGIFSADSDYLGFFPNSRECCVLDFKEKHEASSLGSGFFYILRNHKCLIEKNSGKEIFALSSMLHHIDIPAVSPASTDSTLFQTSVTVPPFPNIERLTRYELEVEKKRKYVFNDLNVFKDLKESNIMCNIEKKMKYEYDYKHSKESKFFNIDCDFKNFLAKMRGSTAKNDYITAQFWDESIFSDLIKNMYFKTSQNYINNLSVFKSIGTIYFANYILKNRFNREILTNSIRMINYDGEQFTRYNLIKNSDLQSYDLTLKRIKKFSSDFDGLKYKNYEINFKQLMKEFEMADKIIEYQPKDVISVFLMEIEKFFCQKNKQTRNIKTVKTVYREDTKVEKLSLDSQGIHISLSCAILFLFSSILKIFFITENTEQERIRFRAQILLLSRVIFDKNLCQEKKSYFKFVKELLIFFDLDDNLNIKFFSLERNNTTRYFFLD